MIEYRLSRDRKNYEILCNDNDGSPGCKFVVTVNQKKWIEYALKNRLISLWVNSANKKYQVACVRKAFMFGDRQIPKYAIIVFDRDDLLWVCDSFAFTVKVDKDGRRRRKMLPKKYLRFMHVECFDFTLKRWDSMILGKGGLMYNIHDAIAGIGVNHVEYKKEDLPDEVYAGIMKDCIRKKKRDNGGRTWDNPYAIIDDCIYRGYTDESHWTGMIGSRVAHYARYN